ncbi:MAG TPA: glycosyltransferase family 2 protein [Anaerolineae bacterium]|nr:glycosyltransferase family 2 protein [Anaerolineae bacterium]HQH37334.1 glycosyltransferase family 2 protein [Anaerolineae bacterium]
MSLAIILLSWNTASLLADCLRSIPAGAAGLDYTVIVVDNASTDGSADMVARDFPQVQLIRSSQNLGFARGNNLGIRAADPAIPYLLLLNSDTIVQPASLTALVRFMEAHPDAGAVGPRLLRPDGTPQPYAFGGDPTPLYLLRRGLHQLFLHRYLHDWATDQIQTVDWVSGACMLVRRSAVEQIGMLDENMWMYFEDNDWCLRFRQAGWKVYYDPQVEIIHLGGQSLQKNPSAQNTYYQSVVYFYGKHYGRLSRWLLRRMLPLYRRMNRSA